jgi:hypothetical protein
MANIPDILDITYAHPDYPELLSKNQLKKRWLKWIKSCQAAQETSEKRDGHMKEQINILKKAINRGDLVNAAEIPVNGDVKKFRNRDAVERGILAGIGERKVNAQNLLTTQQRGKKQNTHPNQTEARRRQQSPAERILELENSGYNNSNGNFQRLFDESEEERKKRLSSPFDLPGPVRWEDWEKWNKKARARKGGKKRKRRKTKRKKSRRRKTKKRKRKTKKRKRKTKKRR